MEKKLAENIRAYRKERGLTQEQLAEVLNVTLSAVSKWETGVAVPDLDMIIALADYFTVSVDVLLGYKKYSGNIKQVIREIAALAKNEEHEAFIEAAEEAITRYPSAFPLLYHCARFYKLMGIKRHCESDVRRAIELYNEALTVVDQNDDPEINARTIANAMARAYLYIGEEDEAISILMSNNEGGRNDQDIGFALACNEERYQEAVPWLSRALVRTLFRLDRIMIGICNVYNWDGDLRKAMDAVRSLIEVLKVYRIPGEISYLDRRIVRCLAVLSHAASVLKRSSEAEQYLREARELAKLYDSAPSKSMDNIRFCDGLSNSFFAVDDIEMTAAEEVEYLLREDLLAGPAAIVIE